jgi:hypothetical protein
MAAAAAVVASAGNHRSFTKNDERAPFAAPSLRVEALALSWNEFEPELHLRKVRILFNHPANSQFVHDHEARQIRE